MSSRRSMRGQDRRFRVPVSSGLRGSALRGRRQRMPLGSLLVERDPQLRPAGQQLPLPLQIGIHGTPLRDEDQLLPELAVQQRRRVQQRRVGTLLRLSAGILGQKLRSQLGVRLESVRERRQLSSLSAGIPLQLPARCVGIALPARRLRRMCEQSLQKQRRLSRKSSFIHQ